MTAPKMSATGAPNPSPVRPELATAAVTPSDAAVAARPVRLLTPAQEQAQRLFAAVALPAAVHSCAACDGAGGRDVWAAGSHDVFGREEWRECECCDGTGRDVIGELPDAREMASRLEQWIAGEMMCKHSDVPPEALDVMALAAAVLRGRS